MKQKELIKFDIHLLLVRYGRFSVLREMAEALNVDEATLQAELKNVVLEKPVKTAEFTVFDLGITDDKKVKLLTELEGRYLNRTFLAELKDVNRFLERNGYRSGRPKSRQVARKSVFKLLVNFNYAELEALIKHEDKGKDFSSLGVISDHIMSRHKPGK
ncbi:hypothetical protein [Xanthomonas arboricola]|uniref:hypothetical protein n=1 Tax=Xanthomonas arboricola TaxID=56448 RepID=UPI000F8D58D1|nr:hypothetical protein [Xanthomonas arboricola]